MIDQATYGSKKDILQREIKFLPRHFIKILEDKQVINWVQIQLLQIVQRCCKPDAFPYLFLQPFLFMDALI